MSAPTSSNSLVPSVLAVLLLDSEGNRIIAKYYQGFLASATEQVLSWHPKSLRDREVQANFETKLFKKTKNVNTTRNDADVIMLENTIVLNSVLLMRWIVTTI